MSKFDHRLLTIIFLIFAAACKSEKAKKGNKLIVDISEDTNTYFSVNGIPQPLIGGSNNDNIFQDHPVEPQLDTLIKYGGNFIRCTLSSRDFANQWPYQQRGDALYDLNVFSEAYWSRLNKFLKITQHKGIVVQLEIWDTRDFYQANNWARHPFNPEYNINYGDESSLPTELKTLPDSVVHPFFETVSDTKPNRLVLRYQEQFIEQLLSVTLPYQHIIYCINNEYNGNVAWSKYWYGFIKQKANEQGTNVFVGDMPGNLENDVNLVNWLDTEAFDFLDLSVFTLQNSDYFSAIDSMRAVAQKPTGLVKVYGGEQNDFTGTIENGPERFWKSIFAKAATVRFHQPPQGAGLNRLAQVNLKSVDLLRKNIAFAELQSANQLLKDRQQGEAYCLSDLAQNHIIYYPSCGEVKIEMPSEYNQAEVRWLNVLNAQWEEEYILKGQDNITLKSPCEGKWLVYLKFSI